MISPSATRQKGQPMIHKNETPVIPLVNFTTAPSYILANKLDTILKNIKFENTYSIKNSLGILDTKSIGDTPHYSIIICLTPV